jgi:hypothetical protein
MIQARLSILAKPRLFPLLVPIFLFSSVQASEVSPLLLQRCAPCHGPDLNGVGGVFPSLMTSELVKKGELDPVIKFIVKGSPADSKSLVKMPAKGGHLDLGDEEIREIAGLVIGLAQGYVEKKPSKVVSQKGFFTDRYGPVVSTGIETAPVTSWPPGESASTGAKALYAREKALLADVTKSGAKELQGLSLEELSRLQSADLSKPSDKVEGTSGNSPGKEVPKRAIDDNRNTKYLNFDGKGSGLVISTAKGVISGLSLISANDAPERDPRSFLLSGSNDGVKFTEIARGSVPPFKARHQKKRISFANDKAYSKYKLIFPDLAGKDDIPMQIAEVELIRKEVGEFDEFSSRARALQDEIQKTRKEVRYIVSRAHLVPLGKDRKATIVFDSDTMTYTMGWFDPDSLSPNGMPFGSAHGKTAVTKMRGNLFQTGIRPGWAKAGSLGDPRPSKYEKFPPLGHLPKDWAHFKGHYVHDGRAIFSYSVGKGSVLDMPGMIEENGLSAITRTLEIDNPDPSMLVLAEGGSGQQKDRTLVVANKGMRCNFFVTDGSKEAKLVFEQGLALLKIPTGKHRIKLAMWDGEPAYQPAVKSAAGKAENLSALTRGGPSQWGEPIAVKSKLAEKEDQAYVVDRIGVPFGNPFDARMRIGGFDFFEDGKTAAVCTWDGDVWIVSDIDEKLENVRWKRFATGLHEPLGLAISDGMIYTVGDNQITRFHDYNQDGEADFLENFNNDWELTEGFHAFCFDLQTGPDGDFYFSMGCPVRAGGRGFERMGKHHGAILRVSRDGKRLTHHASGFRAPNGIGVGPDGQVTCGDNEGTFVPTAPLHWVKPGQFHGVVDAYEHKDKLKTSSVEGKQARHLDPEETPKPLVWMSKRRGIDNSGGGQAWVTSDRWGPLKDQLLHLSYGQSKMYLVLKEEKNGQVQGGVTRLNVPLSSSAMRARINKRDGQLYASGLKGWQTNARSNGGLDRIRYTGKPIYMPKSLRVKKDLIEIGFHEKLSKPEATDSTKYKLGAWNLKWSHAYGSPEIPVDDLKIQKVQLSDDGKTVALHIPNLKPVHMMQIDYDLKFADGHSTKGRIDNTIHSVE